MRTLDNPGFMTSLSINRALPTIDGMLIKNVKSFYEICKNTVLGSKIRFSAQMSNNAKNAMKHSENPT